MNLALVCEGEDTGFVLSGETLCRAELVTELIFEVIVLQGGAPGLNGVGLRAGVIGDAVVGEGEFAPVKVESLAPFSQCVGHQGERQDKRNH